MHTVFPSRKYAGCETSRTSFTPLNSALCVPGGTCGLQFGRGGARVRPVCAEREVHFTLPA
eukprot:scaffold3394_cov385-Prasinococcus_capsulatus_cf.AAC.4